MPHDLSNYPPGVSGNEPQITGYNDDEPETEDARASELEEGDSFLEYGSLSDEPTLIKTLDQYGDTIIVNDGQALDIDEVVARVIVSDRIERDPSLGE